MHGRIFQASGGLFSLLLLAGCNDTRPSGDESPPPTPLAAGFDPSTTGVISGQVRWSGPLPHVPDLSMWADPPVAPGKTCPHPNRPRVDPETKGVGNAVVFLRDMDPARARPWDHPPVRVEMRDLTLHVCQGKTDTHMGFVRRGDTVEMVSRDKWFHALEIRGADFSSLRFADPDRPSTRVMKQKGVVELSSAAGYCWMRAYLLVDEHPYYTHTDKQGRFELPQVPPGTYQVVCWLPHWVIARKERDPESGLATRMTLAPPLEQEQTVRIARGRDQAVEFTVGNP